MAFSPEFVAALLGSPLVACLWDFFWAFLFVGSLYFWKYNEPLSPALRDQLHVVWQRFTSITVVCACFVYLTPLSWTTLGIPSSIIQNMAAIIVGALLPAILYIGPIFYAFVAPEEELIVRPTMDWLTFRNIVFAPLMEEIAFRMCMVPIMLHAGFSVTSAVFLTPLFFGAAHVHHILNDTGKVTKMVIAGKTIRIPTVYIGATVQAAYTSVFGFFTSYLFIQTGTIIAPIVAHAFCNFMQLPPLDFLSHPKGKRTLINPPGKFHRALLPSATSSY